MIDHYYYHFHLLFLYHSKYLLLSIFLFWDSNPSAAHLSYWLSALRCSFKWVSPRDILDCCCRFGATCLHHFDSVYYARSIIFVFGLESLMHSFDLLVICSSFDHCCFSFVFLFDLCFWKSPWYTRSFDSIWPSDMLILLPGCWFGCWRNLLMCCPCTCSGFALVCTSILFELSVASAIHSSLILTLKRRNCTSVDLCVNGLIQLVILWWCAHCFCFFLWGCFLWWAFRRSFSAVKWSHFFYFVVAAIGGGPTSRHRCHSKINPGSNCASAKLADY